MNMERFIQSNRIHMDIHKGDTDGSSDHLRQPDKGRDTPRHSDAPRHMEETHADLGDTQRHPERDC